MLALGEVYRILIAEETRVIESCIRIPHVQRQTRAIRERCEVVYEVEVVESKVDITKRIIGKDRPACGPASSQGRIEVRTDCQNRRVCIVARTGHGPPYYLDGVFTLGLDIVGLTEDV